MKSSTRTNKTRKDGTPCMCLKAFIRPWVIDRSKKLRIERESLLYVLQEIEYVLISLHKIGSYYAPDLPGKKLEYNAETTKFIDDEEVTGRLAKIRAILSEVFDETRGVDDLTDIERALEGLDFWKPGRAN